jgi:hypothetical protein
LHSFCTTLGHGPKGARRSRRRKHRLFEGSQRRTRAYLRRPLTCRHWTIRSPPMPTELSADNAMDTSRQDRKPSALQSPLQPRKSVKTCLTGEQVEALRRLEKGISLRFESWAIVSALIDGGYVERGMANVIIITTSGKELVRTRPE